MQTLSTKQLNAAVDLFGQRDIGIDASTDTSMIYAIPWSANHLRPIAAPMIQNFVDLSYSQARQNIRSSLDFTSY